MSSRSVALHRLVRRREVGIVLALFGAVLVIAGLLRTTAGKPDTDDCPAGTTLVAKFNRSGNTGTYGFEKPAGNENVVTLSGTSKAGGSWTSTVAISALVVKGGPNAVVTSYDPAQTSGTFSNAGLPPVGNGNLPDVSHIEFCTASATTTTTASASTTTLPQIPVPSTTTAATTTTQAGSTTTLPLTTTTVATAATTTVPGPPTTTTSAPETTTTVRDATTTIPDQPTTTVPDATTTVPDGPTTTVGAESATTTLAPGITTTTTDDRTGSAAATSTTVVPLRTGEGGTLPRTGAPSAPLITLGLLLSTAGLALAIVNGRRDRSHAPRSS